MGMEYKDFFATLQSAVDQAAESLPKMQKEFELGVPEEEATAIYLENLQKFIEVTVEILGTNRRIFNI